MKVKNWYLWIIFSSVIYVLPLIIANVSYIDDMGRSIDGYGWIRDGRLLADYVVKGITFGNGIVTVFPFSLILSAVIYAVSGVVISSVLFEIDSKLKRLSSFVFISSPFLLENMAYKFDALPMSLANSTSKCDTRLCRLTVLFEYLDRLPESETFPRS